MESAGLTLTLTLILVLLVFNESVSGFCYLPIYALYLTMLLLVVGCMDLLTSAKSPFDSVGTQARVLCIHGSYFASVFSLEISWKGCT